MSIKSDHSSPAFRGAYMKGRQAALDGKTLHDCPYADLRQDNNKLTFSRAFQKCWVRGFEDATNGKAAKP